MFLGILTRLSVSLGIFDPLGSELTCVLGVVLVGITLGCVCLC